mmetsp:Transcript_34374/g.53394  ORF Transcript_34374/g.53394 Transcript_34374/m.53394 type:complete len:281 (+) Transcript_34374:371-1213(+)
MKDIFLVSLVADLQMGLAGGLWNPCISCLIDALASLKEKQLPLCNNTCGVLILTCDHDWAACIHCHRSRADIPEQTITMDALEVSTLGLQHNLWMHGRLVLNTKLLDLGCGDSCGCHALEPRRPICFVCHREAKSAVAGTAHERLPCLKSGCHFGTENTAVAQIKCCAPTTNHEDHVVICKVYIVYLHRALHLPFQSGIKSVADLRISQGALTYWDRTTQNRSDIYIHTSIEIGIVWGCKLLNCSACWFAVLHFRTMGSHDDQCALSFGTQRNISPTTIT